MPKAWKHLAEQGIRFEQAYATTPLCSPSRASILTGTYAHRHGITANRTEPSATRFDELPRLPEQLRKAGYVTALVGKYLNGWDGGPRPAEFDLRLELPEGRSATWTDFTLNVDGVRQRFEDDYLTDRLGEFALRFLSQAARERKPFLLYFAVAAPHAPATPAERHARLWSELPPHRPPSFDEADLSDKPAWLRGTR